MSMERYMPIRLLDKKVVDAMDVTTWHCLDYRRRRDDGAHLEATMTQEQLASVFVNDRASLLKAQRTLERASKAKIETESEKERLSQRFDQLLAAGQDPIATGVNAAACASSAVLLGKAVAVWQAAEIELVTAQADADAYLQNADRALRNLVAACQPTG